jgi:flagellar basal-body rod modification protein FlgD
MTSVTSPSATAGPTGDAPGTQQQSLHANPLAQKETFLKLLVAQIKNQNPLNPADGIEFLSQLAQFSQLEQMLGMRTELETIRKNLDQARATEAAAPDLNPSKGV